MPMPRRLTPEQLSFQRMLRQERDAIRRIQEQEDDDFLGRLLAEDRTMPPDDEDDSIGPSDEPTLEDLFRPRQERRFRTPDELAEQYPHRAQLTCPDCGAQLILKEGKFGIFYGCERYRETGCKGSHNCPSPGVPAGIPANAETRAMRRKALEALTNLFEPKGHKDERPASGSKWDPVWIQKNLNLSLEETRVASLDIAGCQKILKAVERYNTPYTRFDREDDLLLDD